MAQLWTWFKDSKGGNKALAAALIIVAVVTAAVYWPVLQSDFISYDDTDYVTLNLMVREGLTLKGFIWSFTAFHSANWHPLTWLSHMVDIELFDLNPMGHHATNLVLHAVNSVLLCALLKRLTGSVWRSLLVALLFAIHPLHVESVAWVSERKDVLSTLFWFLTMWAYAGYARRPSIPRYLSVALLLALGLMAKQMLVTLPLVLFLMDLWPLQRLEGDGAGQRRTLKQLVLEKVPLLAISAAAALVTLSSQGSAGAIRRGEDASPLLHAGNALISYLAYLRKMVWPVDLALFYPFEDYSVTAAKVAGAGIVLVAVSALVVVQRKKRPYLMMGWFWYLITLIPVIGFIKVGAQAIADRYTYVPLIGIFIMVAWGVAELAGKWRYGAEAAAAASVGLVAILSVLTVIQIGYWQNSFALFQHALDVVPRNWLAHNNMAILLSQHHRNNEAIPHFEESVRLNPKPAVAFRNLGNAYQMAGRSADAIEAYRRAAGIDPEDVESHYRLGYAYLLAGQARLAYDEYQQLMGLDPGRAQTLLDSIRMSGALGRK